VEVLLKQQEMAEPESSAIPAMEPNTLAGVDIFQDLGLEAKFVSNEQTFGDLEQGREFTHKASTSSTSLTQGPTHLPSYMRNSHGQ